jgi:hypothetical protein
MTQTIQDLGDRYVFGNDDGTFAIWKQVTAAGDLVVGPGYIGRMTFRTNGDRIDGFVPPALSMNDPRWQGLGGFGWHHFRDIPGEPDIWNKGWEMLAHRSPSNPADPFGISGANVIVAPYVNAAGEIRASFGVDWVDRYSAAEGKRIMLVRYDYIVDASQAKVWVTAVQQPDGSDSGPPAYVKEPKIAVGVGGDSYTPGVLEVFDAAGSRLREIDLWNDPKLQDPAVGTVQVGFDSRCRLRFYDGANHFNVVARGSDVPTYGPDGKPTNYGGRGQWEGATVGLDRWAQDADGRARFADAPCGDYCLQGGSGTGMGSLTRQWEVAKRRDEADTEVMLHAWEGGSGLPDCLCCARALVPGEARTAYLSVSRDAGWQL